MAEQRTPLEDALRAEIAERGAIPVSAFMARVLTDPAHGYYAAGAPIGASGDFITAPEVSALFGEIVGAWLVHIAEAIASALPDYPIRLIELGPGRGTLMADILRVAKLRPDVDARLDVHLMEASAPMMKLQSKALHTARPDREEATWHSTFGTLPQGPFVLIANEFFDALPVEQSVMTSEGWRRRMVTLRDGTFAFTEGEPAQVPAHLADAEPGTIHETCPAAAAIVSQLGERLARNPGAALIIDYGYELPALGDTLQAVYRHGYCDPLHHVGEADLTAHVCFGALAEAAAKAGAQPFGPVSQAQFLSELGIGERAGQLIEYNPERRASLETDLVRLVSPDAMGALFKAMALMSPGMGTPPPFRPVRPS